MFESDNPKGPFKPCKINPILTQEGSTRSGLTR